MTLLDSLRQLIANPQTIAAAGDSPAIPAALAVLLLKGAHADGDFSPAERQELLTVLREEFSLTADEAGALLAGAELRAQSSVENFTFVREAANHRPYAERLRLLQLLLRVAAADGKLADTEESKLFQLAGSMHISAGDYGRIKAAARAALRNNTP